MAASIGPRAQDSFPQTGSWNMVDLSSMPVKLLADMFGRAMAARVQPTTLILGVEMGDTFALGKHGRDNVNAALSTLQCWGLLGNSLAVGFSIGHPVRDLAKSEGGLAILGLCAALQEWFVGLRVSMVDDNTDDTLYLNHNATDEEYQVQFRCFRAQYRARGQSQECSSGVPDSAESEIEHSSLVSIRNFKDINSVRVQETYRLPLDDATKMFIGETRKDNAHVVSGRVEWKHALRRAFSLDFDRLWEMKSTLGSLLGCAARISQAIAMADDSIDRQYWMAWTNYCDSSYGHGFINNVTELFPELRMLRNDMEGSMVFDLADAKKKHDFYVSMLRDHCRCKTCAHDADRWSQMDHVGEHASGTSSDDSDSNMDLPGAFDWDPNRFCEVVIAETIIYLCHLLSNTSLLSAPLLPTRTGLELSYGSLLRCRKFFNENQDGYRNFGTAVLWVEAQRCFVTGLSPQAQGGVAHRLECILEVFAGREAKIESWAGNSLSAMCTNGITAFVGLLKDLECQDRDDVSRIYVVPGRIIFEERSYNFLKDNLNLRHKTGKQGRPGTFDDTQEVGKWPDELAIRDLLVKEGSKGLQCVFHLSDKTQSQVPMAITAWPSALVWLLATRRGLIPCKNRSRKACTRRPEAQPKPIVEVSNYSAYRVGDKEVILVTVSSSSRFLTVVASTMQLKPEPKLVTYIVDKECWDCCLRLVTTDDLPMRKHYCFIRIA